MPLHRSFLLLLLLLCSVFSVRAQQARQDTSATSPRAKEALMLEVGGAFIWLGGLQYERRFLHRRKFFLAARTGLGLDLWHSSRAGFSIPLTASLQFGNIHYIELGGGLNIHGRFERRVGSEGIETWRWQFDHTWFPYLGYRYQPHGPGFLFRVIALPIYIPDCPLGREPCEDRQLSPWLGLSLGVGF